METSAERSYSQAEHTPFSLLSEWFRHSVKRPSFRRRVAHMSGQGAAKALHSSFSSSLFTR